MIAVLPPHSTIEPLYFLRGMFFQAGTFFTASFVAILGALLWESWSLRFKDYGRTFGHAVFALFIGIAAGIIAWVVGVLFHGLGIWNIHPEALIAGWGALCLCLFTGARRTGVVCAILLACYAIGWHTPASPGMGNEISGLLAGILVGIPALLSLQGMKTWMERKAERLFLFFFSGSLIHLSGGIKNNGSGPPHPFSSHRKPGDSRLGLIHKEVIPLMNPSRIDYKVLDKPPGVNPDRKWEGSRYVRFLRFADGRIYVVKIARGAGGFFHRPRRIARYYESALCATSLESLGFPVPRVYFLKEGITSLGLKRYILIVEEYINGTPLEPSNPDHVERAVRILARLHSHKRDGWGVPRHPGIKVGSSYIWRVLRPRVLYNIRRISRWYGKEWPEKMTERIWKLFETEALRLFQDGGISYRLIHGDVECQNFLVSGDGKTVWLIDFLTVRFDLAGAEIVSAAFQLTRGFPRHRPKAWNAYFESAGHERWAEFLKQANLSLAFFGLRELAHWRALGVKRHAPPPSVELVIKWLEGLFQLEAGIWGDKPTDTNWAEISELIQGKLPPSS